MATPDTPREPWKLRAADFTQEKVFAQQDWRYLMFYEYLRISPSYTLACDSADQTAFASQLPELDPERLSLIWQTRQDMGDVFAGIFRLWWREHGLSCFGIHAKRPRVMSLLRVSPTESDDRLLALGRGRWNKYLSDYFQPQGRPDALLITIPLAQRTSLSLKQVKQAIQRSLETTPLVTPTPRYRLQENKLHQQRLLDGLRLVYFRAARPEEELWRVASRARISPTYQLDPDLVKKSAADAEARRLLTIMASRLLRETMIVAENAAMGQFPSNAAVKVMPVEWAPLGKRLQLALKRDREQRAALAQAEREAKAKGKTT